VLFLNVVIASNVVIVFLIFFVEVAYVNCIKRIYDDDDDDDDHHHHTHFIIPWKIED